VAAQFADGTPMSRGREFCGTLKPYLDYRDAETVRKFKERVEIARLRALELKSEKSGNVVSLSARKS